MQSRDESRLEQKRFYVWLGIAGAGHLALIVGVLFFQFLWIRQHPPLRVVNVSLVSMPGLSGPAGGPASIAAPPQPVIEKPSEPVSSASAVPESAPAKKPEKKIPEQVAVRKIPEKTLVREHEPTPKKESAADERRNLQAALEKLRKNATNRKPETAARNVAPSGIGSALTSLQKKVASQGSGTGFSGSGSGAGGGRYGSGGGGAFDPYKAKIASIIQNNWSFSSQMVRSTTGMEVYVTLVILPDGSVSQILYDRKSSSEYLNNSVRIALGKSIPFPALPREYGSKGIMVGFVFTPEGIGR
jgi:colicin import membrane protein